MDRKTWYIRTTLLNLICRFNKITKVLVKHFAAISKQIQRWMWKGSRPRIVNYSKRTSWKASIIQLQDNLFLPDQIQVKSKLSLGLL